MAKLIIQLEHDADDLALQGFPFFQGQYIESEDGPIVVIDLGDRTDTSAAQEQYLNTNPNVQGYRID